MSRAADRVVTPPSGELLPEFVASLDPEWIDEALQATGTATIRQRSQERRSRVVDARPGAALAVGSVFTVHLGNLR